jgi:hypothetical protein
MDETQFCRSCENYAQQLADRDRRLARMAEALEGVVEHVAPFVRRTPFTDREVDAALERVETALLLKVGR